MRPLLQWIDQQTRRRTQLAPLADQIADSSLDSVWRRVQRQIYQLPSAEVTGYVRARGRKVVEEAILRVAPHLDTATRSRLYGLAISATIARVIRRLHTARSETTMRKAA